ncbi:MAG: hypothetical protein NTX97_02770 [Bacteroidetes bacterium]|nr:hypothetical protein [Bacteroidota bacterium]
MAKEKKSIPFSFAIENLYSLEPIVKPMFGAYAIYVGVKIVLILRNKNDEDSGVWIATKQEHHASLKKEFSSMRTIKLMGSGTGNWQILPLDADSFETDVNKACELILKGDSRIGTIPKPKKKKIKK